MGRPLFERMLESDAVAMILTTLLTGIVTIFVTIWNSRRQHRKTDDKLDNNFCRLEMREIKTELNQAIDHDYGIEIARKIFNEYIRHGGNTYMIEKYKNYIERKADSSVSEKMKVQNEHD